MCSGEYYSNLKSFAEELFIGVCETEEYKHQNEDVFWSCCLSYVICSLKRSAVKIESGSFLPILLPFVSQYVAFRMAHLPLKKKALINI